MTRFFSKQKNKKAGAYGVYSKGQEKVVAILLRPFVIVKQSFLFIYMSLIHRLAQGYNQLKHYIFLPK